MAVSDCDIVVAAKRVIEQHGAGAVHFASMRVDQFLEVGELAGARTWSRITKAIEELQAVQATWWANEN